MSSYQATPPSGDSSEVGANMPPPLDLPHDTMLSYHPLKQRLRERHEEDVRAARVAAADAMADAHVAAMPKDDRGIVEHEISWYSMEEAQEAHEETVDSEAPHRLGIPPGLPPRSEPALSPYRLRTMIGRGGFGEVWETVQSSLERLVAVKKLRKDTLRDPKTTASRRQELFAMFRQEAITTANLDHPNIVPVHDLGLDDDGAPILAMKMVRGRPWHEIIIEDYPRLSVAEFLARHLPILVEVTQAVAFAHSRGVVHRDLKPQQVMVGEFGEVVLMDWGLAVVFDPESLMQVPSSRLQRELPTPTNATNPAGTVAFMAPEQTEASAINVGPWTDVYLLGGILYCLLTGEVPHSGQDARAVFSKAQKGFVPSPHMVAPERHIPTELAELAMKALSPKVEDRIPSARRMLEGLKEFLSGSSKRRESEEIAESVEETLERGEKRYDLYSECLVLLTRAEGLWAENPALESLRERVYEDYARLALRNRDLSLARLLVDSQQDSGERRRLSAEVSIAEFNARHRVRQRNVALLLAGVLLLGIVMVTVYYNRALQGERDQARAQRDTARAARLESHKLVNFMLHDLQTTLEELGHLEPLRQTSERVLEYYENLTPAERTEESDLQQAEAFATASRIHLVLGDSSRALAMLEKMRDLSQEWIAREPGLIWGRQLAYSHVLISLVQADRGDLTGSQANMSISIRLAAQGLTRQGLLDSDRVPPPLAADASPESIRQAFEATLPLVDSIVEATPGDWQWQFDMAMAYELIGKLSLTQGSVALAGRAHESALDLRTRLLAERPNDAGMFQALVRSHQDLGDVSMARNVPGEAVEQYRAAVELLRQAGGTLRDGPRLEVDRSIAFSKLGVALLLDGEKLPAARAALGSALEEIRVAARREPRNTSIRRELASRYREMARVFMAERDPEKAAVTAGEALRLLVEMVMHDPLNVAWRDDLVASGDFLRLAGEGLLRNRERQPIIEFIEPAYLDLDRLAAAYPLDVRFATLRLDLLELCAPARIMNGAGARALDMTTPVLAQLAVWRVGNGVPEGLKQLGQRRLPGLYLHRAAANAANGQWEDAFLAMRQSWLLGGETTEPLVQYQELMDRLRVQNPERYDLLIDRLMGNDPTLPEDAATSPTAAVPTAP